LPRARTVGPPTAGAGKLKLNALCKANATKVLIQAQAMADTNNTETDIIRHLSLDIDCCQSDKNVRLDDIRLDLPLHNIIT
jgi:hypothetical protein